MLNVQHLAYTVLKDMMAWAHASPCSLALPLAAFAEHTNKVVRPRANSSGICCAAFRLSTDDEGIAQNTLWVTDRRGRKLSNFHAEMLAERIGDFVVYCTPDAKVSSHLCHGLLTTAITPCSCTAGLLLPARMPISSGRYCVYRPA